MTHNENKELSKLIEINKDACKFYKEAQEKVEIERIEYCFSDLEVLHKTVVINLEDHMHADGSKPSAFHNVTDQSKKLWMHLLNYINNDVDKVLIDNLKKAENCCLKSLRKALEKSDIRTETKEVLWQEFFTLRKSFDYIETLKAV